MNDKLNILQLNSTPPLAWATGGCARVTYDLSRQLVKNGHKVTILTTDMHTLNNRYENRNPNYMDNVKVIRFRNVSNYLAWNFKFYFAPGIINFLKKQVKEYDIIHLQDLISIHAVATAYYCSKYKKPYIITTHGSVPWIRKKHIINLLYYPVVKYILKNACKIISLNKSEKRLLEKLGINSDSIKIIPNGVNLSEYGTLRAGNFRNKNDITVEKKIVLYLGRIHQSKGLDLLINSFHDISNITDDVILVIVGPDDGFLSNCKNLTNKLNLQEKVLFLDPLYGIEKMEAYNDADVFVTPKFTGFPMTFLESCLCNTPIITTNLGDSLDWIHDVGIITKYEKNEMSKSIIKILNDEEFKESLIRNCKVVIDTFNWENISKILETVYESCV